MDRDRRVLEACLVQCKNQLDTARQLGNDLLEELTLADLNRILDELSNIYKGKRKV